MLSHVAIDLDKLNATYGNLKEDRRVERFVPCNCATCQTAERPDLFSYDILVKRRDTEKRTIECRVSGIDMNVLALLNGYGLDPESSSQTGDLNHQHSQGDGNTIVGSVAGNVTIYQTPVNGGDAPSSDPAGPSTTAEP